MLMAFPFLMLEDIDEVWEEMIESKPDISATCHFPRDLWNMFDIYSSRTKNICETYNYAINGQVQCSKSNVFKILDLTQ